MQRGGRCRRIRVIFGWLMAGVWLILAAGCGNRGVLADRAMNQTAEKLAAQIRARVPGGGSIGVAPFGTRGPTVEMARKLTQHLNQQGLETVLLPENPMWDRMRQTVDALQGQGDFFPELPEFEFEAPDRIFLGRFLWLRATRSLAQVRVAGTLMALRPPIKPVWSGEAQGAYAERQSLLLRGALFVLALAGIGRLCWLMWQSARRAGGVLLSLAGLGWALAFWLLLWDYVVYLWPEWFL